MRPLPIRSGLDDDVREPKPFPRRVDKLSNNNSSSYLTFRSSRTVRPHTATKFVLLVAAACLLVHASASAACPLERASADPGATVFTDIDETIGVHPNRATGWVIYPGMCELLVALSRGPDGAEAEPIQVLSARFLSCFGIKDGCRVDKRLIAAEGKLGKRHYGWFWDQWRSVICGWPLNFFENRCYYLGKRKMTNILNAFKDQKESSRDFIFCGDDGEGDVIAGTDMLDHPELGSRMRAVLIHEVNSDNAVAKEERKQRIIKAAKARGTIVIFHKLGENSDVADAAEQARQQGLISADGYAKVTEAIKKATTKMTSPGHGGPPAAAGTQTSQSETKPGRRRLWAFPTVTKLGPTESSNSKTLCA